MKSGRLTQHITDKADADDGLLAGDLSVRYEVMNCFQEKSDGHININLKHHPLNQRLCTSDHVYAIACAVVTLELHPPDFLLFSFVLKKQ